MINQVSIAEHYEQGWFIYSKILDPQSTFKFDMIYCDQWFESKEQSNLHATLFWTEVNKNLDNFEALYNLMGKYNFKYMSKESVH